jgi:hypothetical protein
MANNNVTQTYSIGCMPIATVTLTDGRTLSARDYHGDGSDVVSRFNPTTDDPAIRAWLASLDQPALPNKDPKRNADGTLISLVGVR